MTTQPNYTYSLRSKWPGRVETPAAIGAKFVNMLDAFERDRSYFRRLDNIRCPEPEFGRCND
jgi:hypothetical protein